MSHRIPQNDARWSRRHFLHVAGALAVEATCGPRWLAAAQSDAPAATRQRSVPADPGTKTAPLIPIGVLLAHAKDLDHDGDAGHKAAGQGKLDYDRYLALLRACGFNGPLLLHGLTEGQVPGCVAFLREKFASLAPGPSRPGK
jgi:hypothetical protein